MGLTFNITSVIIALVMLIVLCVIVQKNVVDEILPQVKKSDGKILDEDPNNPYGDQSSLAMLKKNLQYVTDCPDYWTPYYDASGKKYTCVSDNPVYNKRMNETLNNAVKSKSGDITMSGTNDLTAMRGITPSLANDMSQSSVISQNENIFYVPNSSSRFDNWDAKCQWTQDTCIPWSGINSSHTMTKKKDGKIVTCQIPQKCLNHSVVTPQKPPPGYDPNKHPIYFYNYALGNNDAVNTNYIPNLYDTNLLIDRSVQNQRKTGLLQSDGM